MRYVTLYDHVYSQSDVLLTTVHRCISVSDIEKSKVEEME